MSLDIKQTRKTWAGEIMWNDNKKKQIKQVNVVICLLPLVDKANSWGFMQGACFED